MKKKVIIISAVALVVAVAVVLACVVSGASCSGNKSNKYATEIRIWNFGGAAGDEWLKDAAARFSESKKDYSYEEGKTGVTFSYGGSTNPGEYDTMGSSTYALYFTESGSAPYQLATGGNLLCIDDWIKSEIPGEGKTLESKIYESYRGALKWKDGKYYALPHYEWFPGLVYDIDTFNTKGLFIADSSETSVDDYQCDFGSVKFVRSGSGAKKSCGNDGKYGTADDGLPTSLTELLVLCDKMYESGVTPFTVPGSHLDYSAYFLAGMLSSLLGEKIQAYYSFSGTFDVVTGFSDENLFSGIDYIKKPITESVTITEKTGYLTRSIVERYYVSAFLQIAEKEGWFSSDSKTTSATNITTQYKFIMGPRNQGEYKPIGFLMEGSYWYVESEREGAFTKYSKYMNGAERNVGWMSLPTSLTESVSENNGRKVSLIDTASSFVLVNKKISSNEGLTNAVKDFILFLYTENELKNFTAKTGITKAAINYDYTSEEVTKQLSSYEKSVIGLKKDNNVIYAYSDNQTFLNMRRAFSLVDSAEIWCPTINKITYDSYLQAIRKGSDVKDVFNATMITAADWNEKYYKE